MTENLTGSYLFTAAAIQRPPRALDAFNRSLALVLIVLGLPIFAAIAIVILVVDGRPVFYRGLRLGIRMRPFVMYKFRSLKPGASEVIGAQVLSFRHRLMIPCGKFLRETRLDEIPQLFNILKGDMTFFGPRPERPAVFERHYTQLDGHLQRFSVKPGLVGISQLFTPHGTPKRLRLFIDRRVIRGDYRLIRRAFLVVYALLAVLRRSIERFGFHAWSRLKERVVLRLHRDRREFRRVSPAHARVKIEVRRNRHVEATITDINDVALLVRLPEELPDGAVDWPLRIEVRFLRGLRPSSSRTRTAHCRGRVIETRWERGELRQVIAYDPQGEWSRYLVEQYLLRKSLACPFRAPRCARALSHDMEHGDGGIQGMNVAPAKGAVAVQEGVATK